MPQYRIGMIVNTSAKTEITVIDASPAGTMVCPNPRKVGS
jgi:hypothetical protein